MSVPKELNFFIDNPLAGNWTKGIEWYSRHFSMEDKVCGEASVLYSAYPSLPGVPEKMHERLPNARLIYVIRNPLNRIVSEWIDATASRMEIRNLEDCLSDLSVDNHYLSQGLYFFQLDRFLRFYDRKNVLVIQHSDLLRQRHDCLRRVFRFIDVEQDFYSPSFEKLVNRSEDKVHLSGFGRELSKTAPMKWLGAHAPSARNLVEKTLLASRTASVERPEIDSQTKVRLVDFFEEDRKKLSDFLGEELKEWY